MIWRDSVISCVGPERSSIPRFTRISNWSNMRLSNMRREWTVWGATSWSSASRPLRTEFRHSIVGMITSVITITRSTWCLSIVKCLSAICKDWFMRHRLCLRVIWWWFHRPVSLLSGRTLSVTLCTVVVTMQLSYASTSDTDSITNDFSTHYKNHNTPPWMTRLVWQCWTMRDDQACERLKAHSMCRTTGTK